MRPTLRQLQYIVAVAEAGRFHEAARRVNVSQPSLSAQIADVETSLDVCLFERGRSGAVVTALGQDFVRRAKIILRDVEALRMAMQEGHGPLSGVFRLGVLPSIGPYLLPSVVKRLHSDYPELRLNVQEWRTVDLQNGLSGGDVDAVVSSAIDHRNMEAAPLFTERLWICAAPDDPLAGIGPIALSALKGRELLTVGTGYRLFLIAQQIADRSGAVIANEFAGTSLDAIRQMAGMGTGLAVLPSLYALTEARRDPDLVLRPIDDPMAEREVSLVWRPTSPLRETFETLADVMRSAAKEILE